MLFLVPKRSVPALSVYLAAQKHQYFTRLINDMEVMEYG